MSADSDRSDDLLRETHRAVMRMASEQLPALERAVTRQGVVQDEHGRRIEECERVERDCASAQLATAQAATKRWTDGATRVLLALVMVLLGAGAVQFIHMSLSTH